MAIDIIFGERVTAGVDANIAGGGLWLSGDDLKRVSGFEFKPQGFCKGDLCVPIPEARKSEFVANERYNLAAIAGLLGQPVVTDDEYHAWSFGEAAAERKRISDVARRARFQPARSRRQNAFAVAISRQESSSRFMGVLVRMPL